MNILDIDKFNLDTEWIEQPKLYMRYVEKTADAREELDILKDQLSVARAELSLAIRKSPVKYLGDIKVTEGSIAACFDTNKGLQKLNKAIIEKKHEIEVFAGMLTSLEQRKRGLENLVELHGRSYFAEPRAKGKVGEAITEKRTRSVYRKGVKRREG